MDKLIIDYSPDEILQLYTDTENRLVIKSSHTEKVIIEKATYDFDCCFDSAKNLYITASTEDGMVCIIRNEEGEKILCEISRKNPSRKISNLRMFCINGMLSLWYCMEHEGDILLVNQFVSLSGNAEPPFAADSLNSRKCFSVCCDRDFNSHIFYKDKNGIVRYLTYRWSEKRFVPSGFSLSDNGDIKKLASICNNDEVHIVYVSKRKDYYGVYHQKIGNQGETVLDFGTDADLDIYMQSKGDKITIYCGNKHRMWEYTSHDRGATFQKPANIPPGKNIICGYRKAGNPLCCETDCCVFNTEEQKPVGTDIFDFATKDTTPAPKADTFFEKETEALPKISFDIVAYLDRIETLLMKITYLTEQQQKQDNDTAETIM